ncbi:hypothetical protein KR018_010431, partial [Drosophila ironensis]
MENAFIKRRSLTLSTRLLQKRHSASPKSCGRSGGSGQDAGVGPAEAPASPSSVVAISDDGDSTPPHKRAPSLDDSVDFSPRLDVSLSPNYLFSQTLATESPEVGWRWNRNSSSTSSAADSGFDSAEIKQQQQQQSLRDRRRQIAFKGCEDRRSQLDNEQWRAQQMKARELLKERCDKLHRQLHQVAVSETPGQAPKAATSVSARTRSASKKPIPMRADPETIAFEAADPLDDFLNDSEMDFLMVEASQQLESKEAAKPTVAAATTPTSCHKSKRPSFYMKFLEDESENEDFLSALEEVENQAGVPKKPRTSLQRYKSMPNTTGGPSSGVCTLTDVSAGRGGGRGCTSTSSPGTSDTPRIKRHSSSHALSPATSHGEFPVHFIIRK